MPESIRQKATNKLAKPNLPNILRLVVTPKSRKKPIAQDELSKIQIPAYRNRERPPLDQDRFGPLSVSPWLEKPWELREFLASSLFQILGSPWETQKTNGLALADELVGLGLPVPWLGFLADLAAWAEGNQIRRYSNDLAHRHHLVQKILNSYRDRVIGRLVSDRHCIAIRNQLAAQPKSQQIRSLAWLLAQWHEEGLWQGKPLVPGQIASLKSQSGTSLEARAIALWESDSPEKHDPFLDLVRRTCDHFTQSQVFHQKHHLKALESGHSGLQLAQYTALRQIQKARENLFPALFWDISNDPAARQEIEQRHVMEDEFPIGGYSSISNRGRFESLLPSQLAFWDEPIGVTDLFTWKYTRDELWYYSRDENAIRKPPLEVAIIIRPGVSEAHNFDREIGFQSLTVLMATVLEAISLLETHRENQALKIRWVFQEESSKPTGESRTEQNQLKGLLRVLLGTRILQEQHIVESLGHGEIEALFKAPRKMGEFRMIQCHPTVSGALSASVQEATCICLAIEGCIPQILCRGMKWHPDPKYQGLPFSWIANNLAIWCQSPLDTPPRAGVWIPVSG